MKYMFKAITTTTTIASALLIAVFLSAPAQADTSAIAKQVVEPSVEQLQQRIEDLAHDLNVERQRADDQAVRADMAERQLDQIREQRDRLRAKFQDAKAQLRLFAGPTLAEQDETWFAGYAHQGGTNPDVFRDTILPCESGTQPDPHAAVGDQSVGTSLGRAQIHRPSWQRAFETGAGIQRANFTGFGLAFDDHITDPWFNGAMAAVIEHEQGLSAWTCYRNR